MNSASVASLVIAARWRVRRAVNSAIMGAIAVILLLTAGGFGLAGAYGWLALTMPPYQAALMIACLLSFLGFITLAFALSRRRRHVHAPTPAAADPVGAAAAGAIAGNPLPVLGAALAAGAVFGFLKNR